MRRTLVKVALLAALALSRLGSAAVVDLEFDSFGSYTTEVFAACAMAAITETENGLLSFGPLGLGVSSPAGGLSADLDGSEKLTFFLSTIGTVGVTQLSYRVESAGNQNGTGPPGEAFLRARGAGDVDLGIRAVSGVGTIDVSALYGGVPISRIDITAAGDAQRIDRLTFTAAPEVASTLLSLKGFGVVQAPEYEICDLLISGSHDIRLSAVGLSVASADPPSLLDSVIEGSESVRFDFATPFTNVLYGNESVVDTNTIGVLAESFVEAYGASGASLGIVAVAGEGSHDVAVLFGGVPISAFRVIANGDGQRIRELLYGPEPGALGLGLAALAALAILGFSKRVRP